MTETNSANGSTDEKDGHCTTSDSDAEHPCHEDDNETSPQTAIATNSTEKFEVMERQSARHFVTLLQQRLTTTMADASSVSEADDILQTFASDVCSGERVLHDRCSNTLCQYNAL